MKLESLKEFQANSLNQAEMNSVLGGKEQNWKQSKHESINEEGCKEIKKDTFDDKNNNGKRDSGESATICVSIEC